MNKAESFADEARTVRPKERVRRSLEKVEAERKHAEEHLVTILETIPDGFLGLDRDWRLVYINASTERMIGRSRGELLGTTFWEEFPDTIGTTLEREFRRALAEKTSVEFYDYFEPADRWYQILAYPCQDGISVYFQDASEGKRLREALQESEAWRRLIIENVKDFAILSTDTQGDVTLWNPGAERLFGYPASEMFGQSADVIFTPEDRANGTPEKEREKAAQESHPFDERWHMRKNGSRFFGSGATLPLFDETGHLLGFTKIVRDITERKQMEDELRTARDRLEATVMERTARLKETIGELEAFSYSLSHDMRTPLRAMRSFSQLLSTRFGEKLGPEGSGFLNRIVSASERLDRLIQDVLSYSRMARNEMPLEEIDVERLINEIIQEHPSLHADRGEIKIDRPLLPLLGHEASLSQCLSNLLTNAVKFVAPGTFPKVRIWTEAVDGHVRLWIEDNGIGVPQEDKERIFGMFHRLHGPDEYEGTGIGLAIVRKAVERMGGEVGVDSEVGKGSKFWLQLPKGEVTP